jgi:hypothetical protein
VLRHPACFVRTWRICESVSHSVCLSYHEKNAYSPTRQSSKYCPFVSGPPSAAWTSVLLPSSGRRPTTLIKICRGSPRMPTCTSRFRSVSTTPGFTTSCISYASCCRSGVLEVVLVLSPSHRAYLSLALVFRRCAALTNRSNDISWLRGLRYLLRQLTEC